MKFKLLSIILTLVTVFTLLGMAAPASAAVTLGPKASSIVLPHDPLPGPYDERYVSRNGDDGTGDGSLGNPWRTITKAVNMLPFPGGHNDRINVFQTGTNQWYGAATDGNAVAEHIVIDQPVWVKAYNGTDPNLFKIDITGQTDPQVIEIISSNVTIDGLFIAGAPVGVFAHPPLVNPPPYIVNVQVENCVVKVDEVPEVGTGIEMDNVKYPDIINNHIYVGVEPEGDTLSVQEAWGIFLNTCFQACVTHNVINVHGDPLAIGIEMLMCPKSLVQYNSIDALSAGDNVAIGIKACDSELIQITDNTIDRVETNGNIVALAFGIKVFNSPRAEVLRNTVIVQNNGVSDPCGFMLAIGIWLKCSNESSVSDNPVIQVAGVGGFNGNYVAQEVSDILTEDDLADVTEISNLLEASIGQAPNVEGAAIVIGIKISDSCLVKVCDNDDVDVTLAADFVSSGIDTSCGLGAGVAIGILACDAEKIMIQQNNVSVDKGDATNLAQPRPDVMVFIKVHSVNATFAQEFSGGLALAVALGIAVFDCDLAMVNGNSVQADATMYADIQSVPAPKDIKPLANGAALDIVNSELMQAVYQSFTDTIQSETVNARISGDPPSIESFGAGGCISAGIGILAVCSDGVVIDNNTPVEGTGDLDGSTWSKEANNDPPFEAEAMMGGLGLGIGVAVIESMSAEIDNNTGVAGNGAADLEVGAQHDPPALVQDAEAFAGGAGVGFGILIVGSEQFLGDAGEITGADLEALEVVPEGCWPYRTVVVGNEVMASGAADKICVTAEDQIPDHPALAIGKGLGLAGGIVAICSPSILIKQNKVSANGNAEVCVAAEAVDTFDPLSMGGAAGVGIGIASVGCWKSEIIDNEPFGQGTAKGFVLAIETPVTQSPAIGFGGSIGLGDGILVFCSGGSLVKSNGMDMDLSDSEDISNAVTTGLGDAKTLVLAINEVPLDSAVALALAAGVGKGIAVIDSPCTDVVECNTAAGEGTAKVCSFADADFDYAFKLGVSISIDILMKLWPSTTEINETSFDALSGPHFGKVNYNSIVDVQPIGENSNICVVVDAGLLKIGWPCLNAQYNWWNDPTGPTGFGPGTGTGEAVYWCGKPVIFTPWLYVVHTDVLYNQIGKFGFFVPLCKGLNTISTPIALEQTVVPSRQWQDIVANSGLAGKIKFVIKWDDGTQTWLPVALTDNFDPLNAYYIYLFEDDLNLILMVNSSNGHPYAMPTRSLEAGWSLIGPNPIFPDFGIAADEALSSIIQTPAGLPGYTQVISPVVRCQPSWYFVPGMKFSPCMESGRGYWVWMENPDTLVGFGFSPLPDQMGEGYH